MLASRVNLLMALSLALGLSGCYGYHVPPSPYGGYGGYGDACAPYGDYGYGGYGNGAYSDGGYGYGGYETYGQGGYGQGGYGQGGYGQGGYGAYGDCVAPGGAYYGDYARPPRRGSGLRERLHARRDSRMHRRDGRRSHGRRHRHHGRRGDEGDFGCDEWGCDEWGCDECDQCFDDCESCSPGGSNCTSCMEGSSSWEGSSGCESCQSGMVGSGMADSGVISSGMMHSPSPTCAGGSCQRGDQWQDGSPTYVPYSHEGAPTEAAPHPIDGNIRESLPVPPAELNVPEGNFGPADGESSVIRGPQARTPVNQTRWVPPRF